MIIKYLLTVLLLAFYVETNNAQEIKFLNPKHGSSIFKFKMKVENGKVLPDSTQILYCNYNILGYCKFQQSDFNLNFSYYEDSILIRKIYSHQELGYSETNYFYNHGYLIYSETNGNLLHLKTYYLYNKDNQLVKIKTLNSKNEKVATLNLKYNSKKQLVKEKRIQYNGNTHEYTFYEYNDDGKISSIYSGRNRKSKDNGKHFYYDLNGKLHKVVQQGCESFITEYLYNSYGNIICERMTQNGFLMSLIKYVYLNENE